MPRSAARSSAAPIVPSEAQCAPNGEPWFEIELLDADGQPVAGRVYEVRSDDGRQVTGWTRPDGCALVVGLAVSGCTIELPEPDARTTASTRERP